MPATPATQRRPNRQILCAQVLVGTWVLAAVHQQVLAGDVAGMHAAQERAGGSELVGSAEATCRMRLGARLVRPTSRSISRSWSTALAKSFSIKALPAGVSLSV